MALQLFVRWIFLSIGIDEYNYELKFTNKLKYFNEVFDAVEVVKIQIFLFFWTTEVFILRALTVSRPQ